MLDKFTTVCLPAGKDTNWQHFEKARVYVLILLLMSIFLVSYFVYYTFNEVNYDMKHVSNGSGIVLLVLSFALLKRTGNIATSATPLAIAGVALIVVNGYHSGGILSVDVFWFLVLSSASTMFLGHRIGIILGACSLGALTYLYIASQVSDFDFRAANEQTGITYEYVNGAVILLISIIMINILERSNRTLARKNEELKQQEIEAIDKQYKFIAEHSQDLVAVVDANGIWEFASSAVQNILGRTVQQVQELPLIQFIEGEQDFNKIWQSIQDNDVDILPFIGPQEQVIFLEVAGTMVELPDQPAKYLLTMRDVTNKERSRQRVANLKSQLARDFHDELGNRLAAISMISRSLKYGAEKTGDLDEKLTSLQDSASGLYKDFRDFIWSIDEANERLSSLTAYLKDFGEELFEHSGIQFYMDASGSETQKLLVGGVKSRQIILMVKESLTNALKHSKANSVKVDLSIQGLEARMCIADNGIGIEQDADQGVGLGSLNQRAVKIGGELEITSEPGQGTQICITFPVQPEELV